MRAALALLVLAGCFTDPPRPSCAPVHALAGTGMTDNDVDPWMSADRLELFFASDRLGTSGSFDIFRATRSDPTGPFTTPVPITGTDVNTSFEESEPFLTPDGKTLWFTSQRHGTSFNQAFTATRLSATEFGNVHEVTALGEISHPTLTADGSRLYFAKYVTSYLSIFQAQRTGSGWGTPTRLEQLEVQLITGDPSISPDGTTLVFASSMPTVTGSRLYRSHQLGTGIFSDPEPVTEVDSGDAAVVDKNPAILPDARTTVFASDRDSVGNVTHLFVGCE